jgi:hypothetical protein
MKYFDALAANDNNKLTCDFLMSYYTHIYCQYKDIGTHKV